MLGSRKCTESDPNPAGPQNLGGTSRFPQTPSTGPLRGHNASRWDHKNSPSRFRFRPPLPLTFAFRLLPSDSVSTYLRSVLGARRNLTSAIGRSRGRKRPWPQFAEISFFNISTAFSPTCGKGCGEAFGREPARPKGSREDAVAAHRP